MILDSLNGSSVSGATLGIVDSSNAKIGTYTTGSGGSVDLTNDLAVGSVYSITAAASGRATSTMLDYRAAKGTTVALYCPAIAMSNVRATAGGQSLSDMTFNSMYLDFQSYGRSNRLFSLSRQVSTRSLSSTSSPSSYGAYLSFGAQLQTGADASILGFSVCRSTDGAGYAKIARVNYGSLVTTTGLGSNFN
jgi:hypothetical protein